MKSSNYPSQTGVPSLALIGVSGAGKSSLAGKLLPKPISSAAKIAGKSSAQTTLIPTQFYIKEDPNKSAASLQLRVTLRDFPVKDEALKIDDEALYLAFQHSITSFAKGSKGSGIPLAALNDYIDSGKFVQDLHNSVNGAVRLEKLNTSKFDAYAANCAKFLLERFDVSEVDSTVSKMKGEGEKAQAKIIAMRDILRKRWDHGRRESDSPIYALLHHTCQEIWRKMDDLLPGIKESDRVSTFSFDMEDAEDRRVFASLLDPYAPLSLVVEKYEVACGIGEVFSEIFNEKKCTDCWPSKRLPFRLVLTDTVGLTQDAQENDDDIAKRLRTALNSGCQGVLLMIPASLRDEKKRTIQRCFSSESEEGRQIRRNKIPVFLGIARADEEITPQTDMDEDEDTFAEEMRAIWERLANIKSQWKSQFHAQEARYLTNQPKKVAAYLDDLRRISTEDETLADEIERFLGTRSALDYIFDITADLQTRLFPSDKPIFFRATQPTNDSLHVRLHVISHESAKEMADALAEASQSYHFEHWLHWRTAYAFRDSVYAGHKFISRAKQNGRIYIYVDGDAKKASNDAQWRITEFDPDQITLNGIDLTSPESTPLYEALGLDPKDASMEDVQQGLRALFCQHFMKENSSWRFLRALDRTVRRVSFDDARIRTKAMGAFEAGRISDDPSAGVDEMLKFYRKLYTNPQLADLIEDIFNDELSKEFNNFFYALY